MKKSYVKPELFYESFVLSQSIAACGIDVNFSSETDKTCQPSTDPNFWGETTPVFNSDRESCQLKVDKGDIEAYCYTSGTSEAGRLFNS